MLGYENAAKFYCTSAVEYLLGSKRTTPQTKSL